MKLRQRRGLLTILLLGSCAGLAVAMVFLATVFWPGWRTPEVGRTAEAPKAGPTEGLKLMSYNIRWCASADDCLDRIAALIKAQSPDLVFLAAVYYECHSCAVENQVSYLAAESGMHAYAFGENYRWGLPFFQTRSGNAVLSRFPIRGIATEPLPNRSISPRARRRVLWAEIELNDTPFLVGSVHNEYYDPNVNLAQVERIIDYIDGRPVLLGGDFNAPPDTASMKRLRSSGLVTGDFDGPKTYPSDNPDQRLDYIFVPKEWTLLQHYVIQSSISAHLPVVSLFATAEPVGSMD